jgi:hypothetical protein
MAAAPMDQFSQQHPIPDLTGMVWCSRQIDQLIDREFADQETHYRGCIKH